MAAERLQSSRSMRRRLVLLPRLLIRRPLKPLRRPSILCVSASVNLGRYLYSSGLFSAKDSFVIIWERINLRPLRGILLTSRIYWETGSYTNGEKSWPFAANFLSADLVHLNIVSGGFCWDCWTPLSESKRLLYTDKGMKKFFNNYWIGEIFLIFLELLIFCWFLRLCSSCILIADSYRLLLLKCLWF